MQRDTLCPFQPLYHIIILFFILTTILTTSVTCIAMSRQEAGRQLAWAVYNRNVGKDSVADMKMILKDSSGSRSRHLKTWVLNQGKKRFTLIRFLSPTDIAGTSFLDRSQGNGHEVQHLYLPALGRARRISGRLKTHRFVNSDFTYEDLERHYPDKYTYNFLGSAKYLATPCWVLESSPKPDIYSQYSKSISWITQKGLLPVRIDYYGKNGKLIKRYTASKWKTTQGIWTIYDGTMQDFVAHHSTELVINQIKYNVGLNPSMFTVRSMGLR